MNSIFLTLGSAVANDFSGNTIVKNSTNTAVGLVLDFIDKPVAANVASVYPVVSTGNTVLRVQMTSSINFAGNDTITAYLVDGRVISVPLAWSWRLSPKRRPSMVPPVMSSESSTSNHSSSGPRPTGESCAKRNTTFRYPRGRTQCPTRNGENTWNASA